MPFDGSGQFSLVPGTIVSEGMTVQPSQHNPPFQDVASGLGQVLLRSGVAPMTGNLNMNGQKVTGLSEGTSDGDAATVGQAANKIGDFRETARTLDDKWLRRDGGVYSVASYPLLAPLMSSVEGTTVFTELVSGVATTLNGYAYALGQHIVVGNAGTILLSPDGVTWTLIDSGTSVDISAILYGGGRYVATLTNGNIITSASGLSGTWTTVVTGGVGASRGLAYGDGVWVVVGGALFTDPGFIYTSPDAGSWTDRTPAGCKRLLGVAYGNGRFVAAGSINSVYYSTSGTTWTSSTVDAGTGENGPISFANGYFFISKLVPTNLTYRSTNGTAWVSFNPSMYFNSVDYGEATYFAVSTGGGAKLSDDAAVWRTQASGSTAFLNKVVHVPALNRFFMVGTGGTILKAQILASGLFRVPNDDPAYGWVKAK